MRNGDISNSTAPYVYFDIDSLLYETKKEKRKLLGIKLPSKSVKVINKETRWKLNYLASKHDVNIVLFSTTLRKDDKVDLADALYENKVTYNRIEFYSEVKELRDQDFIYLFSKDDILLSVVSRKEAMHIDEFMGVFQ